jgi:LPXTG-motif cell wall-anchored protein
MKKQGRKLKKLGITMATTTLILSSLVPSTVVLAETTFATEDSTNEQILETSEKEVVKPENSELENLKTTNPEVTLSEEAKEVLAIEEFEQTQTTEEEITSTSEEITSRFAGGTGTVSNPYLVSTATEFNDIRNDLTAHYKLLNDINLTVDYPNWAPIGTSATPFRGSLDGGGFKINGLNINNTAFINAGLFAYAAGAVFKNFTLENVYVNLNTTSLSGKAGGLVSHFTGGGEITNVHISGNLVASSGGSYTNNLGFGGLVGRSDSGALLISNSSSSININAYVLAGGLVGYGEGVHIYDSFATGNISGGYAFQGGLVGNFLNGVIENSYTTGSTRAQYVVGGLAGRMYQATIKNSYTIGEVYASGSNQYQTSMVGGLVGWKGNSSGNTPSIITRSYAKGVITGISGVGGLVGRDDEGSILDSYATGNVNYGGTVSYGGVGDIGGLIGNSTYGAEYRRNYATGKVLGRSGTGSVGGLIGNYRDASPIISSVFSDNYAMNPSVLGGDKTGAILGNINGAGVINNYRWSRMVLPSTLTVDNDADGNHGAPLHAGLLRTKETYKENSTAWNFSTGGWIWDDTSLYPKLGFGPEVDRLPIATVGETTLEPVTYNGADTTLAVSDLFQNFYAPTGGLGNISQYNFSWKNKDGSITGTASLSSDQQSIILNLTTVGEITIIATPNVDPRSLVEGQNWFEANVTIKPKILSISDLALTKVWDGTPDFEITTADIPEEIFDGLRQEDEDYVSHNLVGLSGKHTINGIPNSNVGTGIFLPDDGAHVALTGDRAGNYTLKEQPKVTTTITAPSIDGGLIIGKELKQAYQGQEIHIAISELFELHESISEDTVFEITSGQGTLVRDGATLILTGADVGVYTITARHGLTQAEAEANLTITPAILSISQGYIPGKTFTGTRVISENSEGEGTLTLPTVKGVASGEEINFGLLKENITGTEPDFREGSEHDEVLGLLAFASPYVTAHDELAHFIDNKIVTTDETDDDRLSLKFGIGTNPNNYILAEAAIMLKTGETTESYSYDVNELFEVGNITPFDGAKLFLNKENLQIDEDTGTITMGSGFVKYDHTVNASDALSRHANFWESEISNAVEFQLYDTDPTQSLVRALPLQTIQNDIATPSFNSLPAGTYYIVAIHKASQNFYTGVPTEVHMVTLADVGNGINNEKENQHISDSENNKGTKILPSTGEAVTLLGIAGVTILALATIIITKKKS